MCTIIKSTCFILSWCAERLSMRLLILQSMFSVGGVWPQLLSCFRNAIKSVTCAQTSILFRNAFKCHVYKKLCTVYRFQCCSGTCGLIVSTSKWQKIMMRVSKKRAGRLAWKRKWRQRAKMQPLPHEVHGKINVWKRGAAASKAKKHMAVLRNDLILAFSEVFETSLTSLNSFDVRFLIPHMAYRPKSTCHAY